jgi:hypothetical protein
MFETTTMNQLSIYPEDILAWHTPEVRSIAERLRDLVRQAVPAATERVYPGFYAIAYRHPKNGYFCGIFPQVDSVNLLFERGALLPDPYGLLEGAGQQVRYLVIHNSDDIPTEPIKELLMAALHVPSGQIVASGI